MTVTVQQKKALRKIEKTGTGHGVTKRTRDTLHRNGLVVWQGGEERLTAKGKKAAGIERAKNPSGRTMLDAPAVYATMVEEASHGRARNASELGAMTGIGVKRAQKALEALEAAGLAKEVGQDADGPCWAPQARQRAKRNPSAAAVAEKKARAWNQNDDLVTKARKIRHKLPESYIEVGPMVAIEYLSNKFDGEDVVYRHEVTKPRQLHISTDGSTLLVKPGFKITKRGIEG